MEHGTSTKTLAEKAGVFYCQMIDIGGEGDYN